MFFDPQRIIHVREMIVADTEEQRRTALAKLLPYQRDDFAEIFRIMDRLPVTIRLLDPPLHEFLPTTDADFREVARAAGMDFNVVKSRAASLHEMNPMLGHRGCRLGITYPEISEMQARAIFEAACDVTHEGIEVLPEVMIPLVGLKTEFDILKDVINKTAQAVFAEKGVTVKYMIGTMIEVPRAALVADKIAEGAEFFSFGTNDLTQMGYGLSRDDAGSFLKVYVEKGLIDVDPFVSLDQEGIGDLVRIAVKKGRSARSDLKIGICGEHGGDPASIHFCQRVGLNYVSCSPYRVPIARLAAAQAALGVEGETNA